MIRWSYTRTAFVLVGLTSLIFLMVPYAKAGTCTGPFGIEGTLLYNSSNNILQYCDGTDWIAMHIDASGGGVFDPEAANCASNNGGPFVEEGSFGPMNDANGVWGDGTYIYVADKLDGLRAYTFDGATFTEKGIYNTPAEALGVWGDGTYIYVADRDSGVRAYTFDGATFTEEGSFNTPDRANEVWGDGTYIYVADASSGLRAYTFDGATFTEIDAFDTPGDANGLWSDGTYIYVADTTGGVRAYTFDGANFTEEGSYSGTPGNRTEGVWGDGTYIYIADYTGGGVRAYTFDGATFTEEGFYDTPGDAEKVWGDGVYIYVADKLSGVRAYSFDGATFTEVDAFNTPSSAEDVWSDGTYIYVADSSSGIRAYSGFECTAISDGDSLTNGLVAHWKLDETSGGTIVDSASDLGSDDGTMDSTMDAASNSVPGRINTAMNFDGTDDWIKMTLDAAYDMNYFSIFGWIKTSEAGSNIHYICSARSFGRRLEGRVDNGTLKWSHWEGPSTKTLSGTVTINDGEWHHVGITYDKDNAMKIYVDGVEDGSRADIAGDSNFGIIQIGGCEDTNGSVTYLNGALDDIRIYDRALNPLEVAALYSEVSAMCTNPAGEAGEMLYNATHNVMQFCDGGQWLAMGPSGNGGAGCVNPTGVAGGMVFNTTYNVMQYCEGDTWIGIGK